MPDDGLFTHDVSSRDIFKRYKVKWEKVHRGMHEWGLCGSEEGLYCPVSNMIAQYLGYPDKSIMHDRFTEDDGRRLSLLAGEHGWSIYQAWKARQCPA